MKTSKIVIKPFQTNKDPVATLRFGNVTIKLEYTAMLGLGFTVLSTTYSRLGSVVNAAILELIREMEVRMTGELPRYHRDTLEAKKLPFDKNPLHHWNGEILVHKDKTKTISPCPYGDGGTDENK